MVTFGVNTEFQKSIDINHEKCIDANTLNIIQIRTFHHMSALMMGKFSQPFCSHG